MCPKPIRAKKARRYGAPCLRHVASFVKFPRFQSKQLVCAKRRNVNSVAHPRRAHSVTKIPPPSRPNPRKHHWQTPECRFSRHGASRPVPYRTPRRGTEHRAWADSAPKTKKGASPRGETQQKEIAKHCPHTNTPSKARHSGCAIHRRPHAVRMGPVRTPLEEKVKGPWRGSRGRGNSSAPRKRSRGHPRRRCGRDP